MRALDPLLQVTLARGAKPLFEALTSVSIPATHRADRRQRLAQVEPVRAPARRAAHDRARSTFPRTGRIAHVAQETPAPRASSRRGLRDRRRYRASQPETELASAEAAGDGALMASCTAARRCRPLHSALARRDLAAGLGLAPMNCTGRSRASRRLAHAAQPRAGADVAARSAAARQPTQHLDLMPIVWLEDWLRRYAGT